MAAGAVLVHHFEMFKAEVDLPNAWGTPSIASLGQQGVELFFVLSGFLITYLLMAEQESRGAISIRGFMLRRALRILPLYYLIVLIAFVAAPLLVQAGVSPHLGSTEFAIEWPVPVRDYWPTLGLFLAILPNIAFVLYQQVLFAGQCWSIGVEEQFYLLWPWLLRVAKPRRLVGLLLAVIAVKALMLLAAMQLHSAAMEHGQRIGAAVRLLRFVKSLRFEDMAVGALGAYCLFHYRDMTLKSLVNPLTRWLAIPTAIGVLIRGNEFPWLLAPVLYAMILIVVSAGNSKVLNLENPLFNYLGRISYGLYMYHPIAIVVSLAMWHRLLGAHWGSPSSNAVLFASSAAITIALAVRLLISIF